jgi:hypothetical protein
MNKKFHELLNCQILQALKLAMNMKFHKHVHCQFTESIFKHAKSWLVIIIQQPIVHHLHDKIKLPNKFSKFSSKSKRFMYICTYAKFYGKKCKTLTKAKKRSQCFGTIKTLLWFEANAQVLVSWLKHWWKLWRKIPNRKIQTA